MNLQFLRFLIQLGKKLSLTLLILLCIPVSMVRAQIEPDGSIPTNVEELRDLLMEISGGEVSGDNLFHSFDEFSIPEGAEAVFQNADSIENIFARVTGDSASLIEGMLSTQGDANLFLMNPNGIVFGEDASLNVGGSFVGTTANGILFEDGNEFAANDDGSDPVLTQTVPIGLGFGSNPQTGNITVKGAGNQLTRESTSSSTSVNTDQKGLQVDPEQTLALIGNGIELEGGVLSVPGDIELGSVASGKVGLNSNSTDIEFDYEEISGFGDITLSQQALVDASGAENNLIKASGENIKINEGSRFFIQGTKDTQSGNLSINATESLSFETSDSDSQGFSGLQTETLGKGDGGDIFVRTKDLILEGGSRIEANTFGEGKGGAVDIDATNLTKLSQSDSNVIRASTFAVGNSGSIKLSTSQLRILDSGGITSSSRGAGAGGNIVVNADDIELTGASPEIGDSSFIAAVASGAGDNGDAGEITLNTSSLRIKEGGTVTTSTLGSGNAGNITVNSSEKIEVSGQEGIFPSSISSTGFIGNPAIRESAGLPPVPSGDAGDVNVNTPSLSINSGGRVSVENEGTGNAGTLSINADDINIGKDGSITAASESGQGGNITLDADNLQIDPNSSITAEAGNQGDGGNININTSNIFAKKSSAVRKRMLPVPC